MNESNHIRPVKAAIVCIAAARSGEVSRKSQVSTRTMPDSPFGLLLPTVWVLVGPIHFASVPDGTKSVHKSYSYILAYRE